MDINVDKNILNNNIRLFTRIGAASAVLAIAPLIWAGYQVFQAHSFFQENELGDFIGGTSGTFASFAGLAFVYVGFLGQRLQILMQQEELELNRQEMRDTRMEIQGQKEQLEMQNRQFQKQSFERVFFDLISFFKSESKEYFKEIPGGMSLTERLYDFYNYFLRSYGGPSFKEIEPVDIGPLITKTFDDRFSREIRKIISIKDMTLNILKHLDNNKKLVDTFFFREIFRSSLNVHEQQLLFYLFFSKHVFLNEVERNLFKQFLIDFEVKNLIDPRHKICLKVYD